MSLGGADMYRMVSALDDVAKPQSASLFVNVDNRRYGVYLKEKDSDRFSRFDLENTSLISGEDEIFRVGSFGALKKETTTSSLHKEDRQYIRLVSFEYMGSAKFGGEYLDVVLAELKTTLPLGYTATKQTYSWDYSKAKRQYGLLAVLVVGIFFICSVLFENFKQPLVIIFIIPVSFIGLFLIFSLFDFYFDQGGYAAFV